MSLAARPDIRSTSLRRHPKIDPIVYEQRIFLSLTRPHSPSTTISQQADEKDYYGSGSGGKPPGSRRSQAVGVGGESNDSQQKTRSGGDLAGAEAGTSSETLLDDKDGTANRDVEPGNKGDAGAAGEITVDSGGGDDLADCHEGGAGGAMGGPDGHEEKGDEVRFGNPSIFVGAPRETDSVCILAWVVGRSTYVVKTLLASLDSFISMLSKGVVCCYIQYSSREFEIFEHAVGSSNSTSCDHICHLSHRYITEDKRLNVTRAKNTR